MPSGERSSLTPTLHQHLARNDNDNSAYCAYASGLLAYTREIVARTEQYFCPIKHARQVLGTHARYVRFLDYGDAGDYHARLERFRAELATEQQAS